MKSIRLFFVATLLVFFLPSCATYQNQTKNKGFYWDKPDVIFKPHITVDLSSQTMYIHNGDGKLICKSIISSGRKHKETPRGRFVTNREDYNHRSSIYGSYVSKKTGQVVVAGINRNYSRPPKGTYYRGALLRGFVRLNKNTAYGFHAGSTPGYPNTNGCIHLPDGLVDLFYYEIPTGTTVEIIG